MAAIRHSAATPPPPWRDEGAERVFPAPDGPVDCRQIQSVLFDYMARELGDGQSLLVREHLRRCDACRREAAVMQETIDLLRAHDPGRHAVPRLSESRRRRLLRALLHPVMDWIIVHHWLVAALAALLLLGGLLGLLAICDRQPDFVPIWIRTWRGAP
jgi:anti-sigma factor RsiW